MTQTFRGNGKLLLTGEYFILDGVPGLAVPTRWGQRLTISPDPSRGADELRWTALTREGEIWFTDVLRAEDWQKEQAGGGAQVPRGGTKARIEQLLAAAEALSPGSTTRLLGQKLTTELEFDQHWGLGSSSTLVACLAQLLEVNAYALLAASFGGSGYDLACAQAETPILYTRRGHTPEVEPLAWRPAWTAQTVFVYRNQKQNSREGIRAYRQATVTDRQRQACRRLSLAFIDPTLHLRAAAHLLQQHETLVAEILGQPPLQEAHFPDFPGQLKSLGAWGGDFFWALSEESPEKVRAYFNERGYGTVIAYDEMVR